MELDEAKKSLDKIINKARVHLYKPIQLAEILYRDRVIGDIDLLDLETYRNDSKRWRDEISLQFLGRRCTSSARFQDDMFNKTATPPECIDRLGKENRPKNGIVESYIYKKFGKRYNQMFSALSYSKHHDRNSFELDEFIGLFWKKAGLKRSIDKMFEIVVYALFEALVEEMDVKVEVTANVGGLLEDFEDFAKKVLGIDSQHPKLVLPAKFHRLGVTNAADRGLDMWANYGPVVQIKHVTLDESNAKAIAESVTADRIVIVCKSNEASSIFSLVKQLGWESRIQSIITQTDLDKWYEKALRGKYGEAVGDKLLKFLREQIIAEFPSQKGELFQEFIEEREYTDMEDVYWSVD